MSAQNRSSLSGKDQFQILETYLDRNVTYISTNVSNNKLFTSKIDKLMCFVKKVISIHLNAIYLGAAATLKDLHSLDHFSLSWSQRLLEHR